MTAADVNVTELVARAAWDHDNAEMSQTWRDMAWSDMGGSEPAVERAEYEIRAAAALAALRSPEVVAGIAGVLWRSERWPEANAPESWDAAVVEAEQWPDGYWAVQVRRIRTRARAVVEWLAGGGR